MAPVTVTVPLWPTGGVLASKPAGTEIDWKSVSAGSWSRSVMFVAVPGPSFVMVAKYVTNVPGTAGSGVA